MATADKPVVDLSVEGFGAEDLFFSRTDERGIIAAANSVFMRLSGYDRDYVLGAPHKIIRHPDMPRAVFKLMWDQLQAGRSFAGYVKNRAEDGRYYWVFALAVPVTGGYMSVRLKPGGALFDKVQALYTTIRAAEKSEDQSPEMGVAQIDAFVRAHGFPGYAEFSAEAFSEELAQRCAQLGRPADGSLAAFTEIRSRLNDMTTSVDQIIGLLAGIKGSPTNLAIQGGRLQSEAETIKVIAQNFGILAGHIETAVERMQDSLRGVRDAAHTGRMGYCGNALLAEAIPNFAAEEAADPPGRRKGDASRLQFALEEFGQRVDANYGRVSSEIAKMAEVSKNLKRAVSGLAMTRVMCRMEAARISEGVDGIDSIGHQLNAFQKELGGALDGVIQECRVLSGLVDRISGPNGKSRRYTSRTFAA